MPRWLWKKSVDDEVAEELDFHLEMRTREYMARGLDPDAARAAASGTSSGWGPRAAISAEGGIRRCAAAKSSASCDRTPRSRCASSPPIPVSA
ncbi:MAG TPA: permease prefix domain 1-containing protein [Thermoanaerobaculia bacterium]|nr:permease prefix domain 1-containing protein [Thermoanaerobaculia bacterium]